MIRIKKFLLYLFGTTIFLSSLLTAETVREQRGKVIFLNGTSSAGKTTLSHKLQEIFEEPFIYYAFDSFVFMLDKKYLLDGRLASTEGVYYEHLQDEFGNPLTKILFSPTFHRMYHTISPALVKSIISNGGSVILDEIMIEDTTFSYWQKVLSGENVVYVAVKAPIEVLEKREKERGDRPKGLCRYYAERTHDQIPYDLVVDTNNETPEEIAAKISAVYSEKFCCTPIPLKAHF